MASRDELSAENAHARESGTAANDGPPAGTSSRSVMIVIGKRPRGMRGLAIGRRSHPSDTSWTSMHGAVTNACMPRSVADDGHRPGCRRAIRPVVPSHGRSRSRHSLCGRRRALAQGRDFLWTGRLLVRPRLGAGIPVLAKITNEPTVRFAFNHGALIPTEAVSSLGPDDLVDDWEQIKKRCAVTSPPGTYGAAARSGRHHRPGCRAGLSECEGRRGVAGVQAAAMAGGEL